MANNSTPEAALSTIKAMTSSFTEKTFTISEMIATTGLIIALLFVVYEVASNKPKAREYTIAWFIAVILYIIFLNR